MSALGETIAVVRRVCATPTGAVGLVLVVAVVGAAVFAPWVSTHDPDALDVMNRFSPPLRSRW